MPLHLASGTITLADRATGEEYADLYAGVIAALYGLTVEDILKANPGVFEEMSGPIQNELLRYECKVGSVITIPADVPSLSPAPEGAVASASTGNGLFGGMTTILWVGLGMWAILKIMKS